MHVENYGYPASAKIGETPMPEYTGRVMEKIPDFIPVWTLVLGGIYWVSHRRDEVAAAEAAAEKERERTMKFKLTFWRVVFPVIMVGGTVLLVCALFPRAGRGFEHDATSSRGDCGSALTACAA